ncbi:9899_t:CDS:2 [Ambispora gerdemannii]|uniref:non-specific serine/threonine protein kinase n=1 Tax=Ambispora gerdemannii TaxID=144530 RepID=A0A9N9ACF7_9GLOM|nr:9899_t:CDS:2 [Ambispora gerdemannii]
MEDRDSNRTSSLTTTEIGMESVAPRHAGSNVAVTTSLDPVFPINLWQRRGSTGATSYHSGSSAASSGDEERSHHRNHQSVNLSSDAQLTSKKKKGLRLSLRTKSHLQTLNSDGQNSEGSISQSFAHETTPKRDSSSVDYSNDPQNPPESSPTSSKSLFSFFSSSSNHNSNNNNSKNNHNRSSISSLSTSNSLALVQQRQTNKKIIHQRSNTAHGFEVKETHTINKDYDPMTGNKVINKYMLIREVGRGVHGKVKLGRDTETDELVAIKIVDRTSRRRLGQRQNEPSNEQKIRKEIAILKKCVHPHVVSLKEVIDDPMSKKIYMVLEYMEGGEIQWKDENDKPIMSIEKARQIFRDVVLGLEYLHHQRIIHRDIKPANLLLTADHVVKISDFGVSHFNQRVAATQDNGAQNAATGNDTELAKTAGSPAFFAPELCFTDDIPLELTSSSIASAITNHAQALSSSVAGSSSSTTTNRSANRPPITKAIDVWALGVTLYCFIFGQCPFIADTEFELFFNVIPRKPLEFPENIPTPNDLKDLLARLLEKDPYKRITLEEVKKHPWVVADLPNPDKWREETDPKKYQAVTVTDEEVKGAYTLIDRLKRKIRKISVSLGNLALGFRKRSKSISGPSTKSEETASARRRISKDLENFGIDSDDQQPSLSSSSSRSTLGISPATSSQNTVVAALDHYARPGSRTFASKRKSNNSHSSLNKSWVLKDNGSGGGGKNFLGLHNQNHSTSSDINGDGQNNITDSDEDDGGVVFVAKPLRHHHNNSSY